MPIDKFRLDTDLSQYIGYYIWFEKNQYNHISSKKEKIISATKSELRTEKGLRIRVTWRKTDLSSGSTCKIVGDNDRFFSWTIKGIYGPEEMNQIVAESMKKIVQQYQSALNLLRVQTVMLNDKLNQLYSSIDFESNTALDRVEIKRLSFTEMVELTRKIQEITSKI